MWIISHSLSQKQSVYPPPQLKHRMKPGTLQSCPDLYNTHYSYFLATTNLFSLFIILSVQEYSISEIIAACNHLWSPFLTHDNALDNHSNSCMYQDFSSFLVLFLFKKTVQGLFLLWSSRTFNVELNYSSTLVIIDYHSIFGLLIPLFLFTQLSKQIRLWVTSFCL